MPPLEPPRPPPWYGRRRAAAAVIAPARGAVHSGRQYALQRGPLAGERPHHGAHLWGALEAYAQFFPWAPSAAQRREADEVLAPGGPFIRLMVCPRCRGHYDAYTRSTPADTRSKGHLVRWVLALHNAVNRRKGRPEWTYAEVNASFHGPLWRQTLAEERMAEGLPPDEPPEGDNAAVPRGATAEAPGGGAGPWLRRNAWWALPLGASVAVLALASVAAASTRRLGGRRGGGGL